MRNILWGLISIQMSTFAQSAKQDSLWLPFKIFIGRWIGDSNGEGKYERSYEADVPTLLIALATVAILLKFKKLQEPVVIVVAACIGILLKMIL